MPLSDSKQNAPEDEDDEGDSGSGDFGRPELRPNLEALFDPASVIAEGRAEGPEAAVGVERFGQWDLHEASLMLFHRQMKKRLMLEQLNAPSKMMKVIVALATQPGPAGQWDIENLLKALDAAVHRRFSKGLYQIASMSSDSAKLDWRLGTLTAFEQPKPRDKAP